MSIFDRLMIGTSTANQALLRLLTLDILVHQEVLGLTVTSVILVPLSCAINASIVD